MSRYVMGSDVMSVRNQKVLMFLVFRLFKLCLSIDFQPLTSACADTRNNRFVMRSNVMKLLIFPPRQVLFIDNWAVENFVCILNSIFLHSQDTKSHSVSQSVSQSISQLVSQSLSLSVSQRVIRPGQQVSGSVLSKTSAHHPPHPHVPARRVCY